MTGTYGTRHAGKGDTQKESFMERLIYETN